MARRGPKHSRDLPDHHLWVEVKRSVTPLRPEREAEPPPIPPAGNPLPLPPAPQSPKKVRITHPEALAAPPLLPRRKATPPGREIEPSVKRRVARGHIDIDGRIDLHGMRQEEAREALRRFIRARHGLGARTLLVITGKGSVRPGDSPDRLAERGILRAMLPFWLQEADMTALVAGFDGAARGHGGDGAFYVRLKRSLT